MAGRRVETPSEAVFSGCMYLFIGIFIDFIMLMAHGFPNNPAWIVFFIMPGAGICLVGMGLYYRNKGLGWNEYFPWIEKRILRNYPAHRRGEEMPLISGWWKICEKCDAKADLDAAKCPACGDAF